MTREEYDLLLKQRGLENLETHKKAQSFEGTVLAQSNNAFELGKDYELGDYVTVADSSIGAAADLQITGITKSLTADGEVVDIIFGEEQVTIYDRVKKNERR